jgi:hypothetical protein
MLFAFAIVPPSTNTHTHFIRLLFDPGCLGCRLVVCFDIFSIICPARILQLLDHCSFVFEGYPVSLAMTMTRCPTGGICHKLVDQFSYEKLSLLFIEHCSCYHVPIVLAVKATLMCLPLTNARFDFPASQLKSSLSPTSTIFTNKIFTRHDTPKKRAKISKMEYIGSSVRRQCYRE